MPGLAFDRQGTRIGFGKGYYDSYLKRCPSTIKTIAIGHSSQLVESVPIDALWDMKPGAIVVGGPESPVLLLN